MIKRIETDKQKLFDGDEHECLQQVFEIEDQKIKLIDFYNNPLRALKEEIDSESFETIVKQNNFEINSGFIEKYTSEKGLEIHYLIINDMIYLFSYGEYQPARYILSLEGIWYYSA